MNEKIRKRSQLDMVDLIDDHNSLLLRNKDGRILFFDDCYDMYRTFLKRMKSEFPKGYIEPCFYVMDHYGLNSSEVKEWFNCCERSYRLQKVILIDWDDLSDDDITQLTRLAQSLHSLLGTPYRMQLLLRALNDLNNE